MDIDWDVELYNSSDEMESERPHTPPIPEYCVLVYNIKALQKKICNDTIQLEYYISLLENYG